MEDNYCGNYPEKKMSDIESSGSDLCPVPIVKVMETDVIPDPKAQLTEDNSSCMIPDLQGKLIYRCKKCRQIVASDETIVSHKQGNGDLGKAGFRGRKNSLDQNAHECTAIFVEPLKWMAPVQEGYLSEKLYCIGCKGKLGAFSWVGMQCSCGAWVRPAFQIQKSRVDECRI